MGKMKKLVGVSYVLLREHRMMMAGVLSTTLVVVTSGWWLWHMKSSADIKDADSMVEANKKGAITEGFIDGKDYGTDYRENETAMFEALVIVRDQMASDREEDAVSSLKRGDVLAVRKRPHLWSDTERTSYLIVSLIMTGREANMLLAPKKDGERIVLARAQKINLDQVGFSGESITSQSLEDKIFDKSVIVTK